MAKEWILNSVMNRFQLNFKRNVGATSESIRNCSPESRTEWQKYYYKEVRDEQHITDLGKRLFEKITGTIAQEVKEITEEDCIKYMHELVINRTFDGYMREIDAIYGELQALVKTEIEEAPDEWDRKYNVDFFIKIKEKFIGLQVKPVNSGIQLPQIYKEYALQKKSHDVFTEKYGGKVFYIFSEKIADKKSIINIEVVDEIKAEIKRLS